MPFCCGDVVCWLCAPSSADRIKYGAREFPCLCLGFGMWSRGLPSWLSEERCVLSIAYCDCLFRSISTWVVIKILQCLLFYLARFWQESSVNSKMTKNPLLQERCLQLRYETRIEKQFGSHVFFYLLVYLLMC